MQTSSVLGKTPIQIHDLRGMIAKDDEIQGRKPTHREQYEVTLPASTVFPPADIQSGFRIRRNPHRCVKSPGRRFDGNQLGRYGG